MTKTIKEKTIEKIVEAADKVSETAKTMKCKPSHDTQRAAIGGGYLVCSTCSDEIPNV